MRQILIVVAALAAVLVGPPSQANPAAKPDPVGELLQSLERKTAPAASADASPSAQNDVVVHAMSMVGTLYQRGGTSQASGFDCSGLVKFIFAQTAALNLPRTAHEQSQQGSVLASEADLQAGDLVFYNTLKRPFSHVGIYVGNGQFVHSPRTGARVRLERMTDAYWTRRYEGARRLITPSTTQ